MVLNQRDFVDVPVSGAPVKLADFLPLPASNRFHHALIGVSGGAIRWLAISDGKKPSPSFGSYVGAGGKIEWLNPEVDYAGLIYNASFVKVGPADANLEVSLFW